MDMKKIYSARVKKLAAYLKENNIFAAFFEDSERGRDVSVRYLTGMPSDAVLIVTCTGKSILSPWDEILASKKAFASKVIPFNKFSRDAATALKGILTSLDAPENSKVSLPPSMSVLDFKKFKREVPFVKLEIKEEGPHNFVRSCRAVKDAYEIECTKKACSVTDEMTNEIEHRLKKGLFTTETQVALYIEEHLRKRGCERTSFDTLAAGPSRSFAIHAFPGYTAGLWGSKGLSILDYGVCWEGYASDCTLTIAKGRLSKEHNLQLELIQTAADDCLELYKPGLSIKKAAEKADEIFAAAGRKMPHSLGHGTGLQIHEEPFVSLRADKKEVFLPGNIVTLEPGLYDEKLGGSRLENDVLITETGNLLLTSSRIIRL